MCTGQRLYERIVALRATRETFAICTVVKTDGSVPQKPGAKMLIRADGAVEGTIGGGAIEYAIVNKAREALKKGHNALFTYNLSLELAMCCGGGMTVFVEVQKYPPTLYLFGCGHIGTPLARICAECGFLVHAVDGRADFAKIERFGGGGDNLKVTHANPLDMVDQLPFDANATYVVVATHDHDLDEDIIAALLDHPFKYLGCIGSLRKRFKFRKRLQARGYRNEDIAKMQTPMGIDIGAKTPHEIAVSVAAELIGLRHEAPVGKMKMKLPPDAADA